MILMLVHIAHAAVAGLRAGFTGQALAPNGQLFRLPPPARIAEAAASLFVLATLAIPAFLPLLPLTLLVGLIAALVAGHLHWRQSIIAVAALVIALLAHRQIQFPLPFFSANLLTLPQTAAVIASAVGWAAIFAAAGFGLFIALFKRTLVQHVFAAIACGAGLFLAAGLYRQEQRADSSGEMSQLSPLAGWARNATPKDALFLTPGGFSNFRIQAERSLVADWRDGTQLYFSAAFAPAWFKRMRAIEPDMVLSDDGKRLLSRGHEGLDALSDQQLLDLAKNTGPLTSSCPRRRPRHRPVATHSRVHSFPRTVMPTSRSTSRSFAPWSHPQNPFRPA